MCTARCLIIGGQTKDDAMICQLTLTAPINAPTQPVLSLLCVCCLFAAPCFFDARAVLLSFGNIVPYYWCVYWFAVLMCWTGIKCWYVVLVCCTGALYWCNVPVFSATWFWMLYWLFCYVMLAFVLVLLYRCVALVCCTSGMLYWYILILLYWHAVLVLCWHAFLACCRGEANQLAADVVHSARSCCARVGIMVTALVHPSLFRNQACALIREKTRCDKARRG